MRREHVWEERTTHHSQGLPGLPCAHVCNIPPSQTERPKDGPGVWGRGYWLSAGRGHRVNEPWMREGTTRNRPPVCPCMGQTRLLLRWREGC